MNSRLNEVIHIVAAQFGVKVGTLTAETRFVEDLHESLEFTETIMACEEAFGISIPDEEAVKLVTIGLLATYIEGRLPTAETVWPPVPREDARK